ncbi:ArsC/Spx/MgsR family protein [Lactococcus allomyrinae]|uniref:Transcriptional regulator Spx n=1 Tax=Lactococcus allomyrinae TaxID=2419773 RepID=A0A387BHK3_9LACT|nr:ArsC/Spx/MgsR family protein [Lactococcus allomyrinae]AYG00586.1 transcriptional regulator Spx [Lactococcus allomyrinae]
MIKVYKRENSDKRAYKAVEWLESHQLPYKIITRKELTGELIKEILLVSDRGFDEIMVSRFRVSHAHKLFYEKFDFEKMTVNRLVHILLEFPELLRSPIIFDEKKILVGFNGDEIRKFLPRTHYGRKYF